MKKSLVKSISVTMQHEFGLVGLQWVSYIEWETKRKTLIGLFQAITLTNLVFKNMRYVEKIN